MKLTKHISKQAALEGLLIIIPLYFFCSTYIINGGMFFIINTFDLSITYNQYNVFLNFIADLVMAAVVVYIFRKEIKEQIQDFINNNTPGEIIIKIAISIGILYLFEIVGNLLSTALSASGSSESVNQSLVETLLGTMPSLTIISIVVLAPILEESIFRLFVFNTIYPKNRILAYITSGFIFGFIHVSSEVLAGNIGEMAMIFPYLFIGLALCFIYEKTDNICYPILCHATLNAISVILIMFIG